MPRSYDEVMSDVRSMLVDILGVEESELKPEAGFFTELGGESIEVLELQFQCDRKYGIKIQFQELFRGTLGADLSWNELRTRFDFLDWDKLGNAPTVEQLKASFTVDAIVRILQMELANHERAGVAGRNALDHGQRPAAASA